MLALLGSGVAAVRTVLLLALGESATSGAITNLARALSVGAVSGIVIAYHVRTLRRDLAAPRPTAAGHLAPSLAEPKLPYAVAFGSAGGSQRIEWFATREAAYAAARAAPSDTTATVLRREDDPPLTSAHAPSPPS